jgi:hypothetical protein
LSISVSEEAARIDLGGLMRAAFLFLLINRQLSGFLFSKREQYFVSKLEGFLMQFWRNRKTFRSLQSPTAPIGIEFEDSALLPD